jgi:hypothetical protein
LIMHPVALVSTVPISTNLTLAWNIAPTGMCFDCYTVWGSTNLVDWFPMRTCNTNTTQVIVHQTNVQMFFVVKAEIQSPPSNIVTNLVLQP